jgi:signal transduction histidine kinase
VNHPEHTVSDLVERLTTHRLLKDVPREQLEWLAAHSTFHRFEAGEIVSSIDTPVTALYVLLSGHMVIRVERASSVRRGFEWFGGDVGGLLPYSRLSKPPGNSYAEEPSEILMIDRSHFPELIKQCHEITTILVHVMLDRARRFARNELHDEKMISLGRLAAGLAHELNNPASAVARSARELAGRLFELEATSLALGAANLSNEQLAAVMKSRSLSNDAESLSPLDRADREEAVADWLAKHGLRDETAASLSDSAMTVEGLESLAKVLDPDALGYALHSIGASHRARRLTVDIETAASRVHDLVAAIKGFTYMDQHAVPTRVSIRKGLSDTMTVLGSKARSKSIQVTVDVGESLPDVEGFGGELNQVWSNLIDNAIDAAPESGHVEVCAGERDGSVVVTVIDDGPGIPPDRIEKIFEPFFTTKPLGQGTGLGLDIVQRVVQEHRGKIELTSRPGRTQFCVILPRADAAT